MMAWRQSVYWRIYAALCLDESNMNFSRTDTYACLTADNGIKYMAGINNLSTISSHRL